MSVSDTSRIKFWAAVKREGKLGFFKKLAEVFNPTLEKVKFK